MPKEKRKKQKRILLFTGIGLIIFGLAVEALLFSLKYENLWLWYDGVLAWLQHLEDIIMAQRSWKFVTAVIVLYLIKCVFPIYTTSTVFFITGAVLPMKYSIPLNILGTIIQFTIKYFWGYRFGAPYAWKLASKQERFRRIIESGGNGNPYTLLGMRLLPFIPVNTVSSVYGSFGFGFWKYLGISMAGFMPRIIIYTFVGHNIYDPLSSKFLVPVMLLAFVSGFLLLSANGVWTGVEKISHLYKEKKANKAMKRKYMG